MESLQNTFRKFKIKKSQLKNINGGASWHCYATDDSKNYVVFNHKKDMNRWKSLVRGGHCSRVLKMENVIKD
jgi:hypothetical protein